MLRFALIGAAFAVSASALNAAQPALAAKPAKTPARQETCESVRAIATGFGQENVTVFANGNLDLAIDGAKNRLADKGARGFAIRKRSVACQYYIDFGGAIGKEHKCTASAQLCGKI